MFALLLDLAASGITLGSGRTIPTAAAVIGLAGVVFALATAFRPMAGKVGRWVGPVLGLISLVVGGLHAAFAAGGVGTGNGLAGAFVAVAFGVVAIAVGAAGYLRAKRTA